MANPNEDKSVSDYEKDVWLMKAKVPACDVDLEQTVEWNIEYPFEKEITLKTDERVKIEKIVPYYDYKAGENREQLYRVLRGDK